MMNSQLFRVGFIAALVLALLLIAGMFLPLDSGDLPSGGTAWLQELRGNGGAWTAVVVISVLADLLFLPVTLALYTVLEPTQRGLMLLASGCVALFVVLDLAATWTSYSVLLSLRTSQVGAAEVGAAFLDSPLDRFFSSGFVSLAIALISVAMLRGSGFRKVTGVLGLAAAVTGFVAVSGLPVIGIIHARVTAVWLVAVAGRLRALYRESRAPREPSLDLQSPAATVPGSPACP